MPRRGRKRPVARGSGPGELRVEKGAEKNIYRVATRRALGTHKQLYIFQASVKIGKHEVKPGTLLITGLFDHVAHPRTQPCSEVI